MEITYEKRTLLFETFFSNKLTKSPHMHKEIELIYLISGCCVAVADNNRTSMQTGDLFIGFPNQIHYYLTSLPIEVSITIFSIDMIFGLEREFQQLVPENNVIHIEESSLAYSALNHLIHSDSGSSLTAQAGYLNLLMADITPRLRLTLNRQHNSATLHSILHYCENHFREELSLDTAAETLHISKYYISRLLNDRVQLGFSDYLNTLRINEACILLETDRERKIADISEEVGFGSIRSFNRAFQKVMKMTPAAYKKLVSREKSPKALPKT